MFFRMKYDDFYSLLNDVGEVPSLNAVPFATIVAAVAIHFSPSHSATKRAFVPEALFPRRGVQLNLPLSAKVSRSNVDASLASYLTLPFESRVHFLNEITFDSVSAKEK